MLAIVDEVADVIGGDRTPDVVVGILRGGMIPAVRLAHVLGLRDVRALDVTHTVQDGVGARKTASPVVRNLGSLGDLSGLDVLLVDDVAGTGQTMRACRSLVAEAGARTIRAVACVRNEANWPADGGDPYDSFTHIGVTLKGWVVFPWETQ
jgi:hypoxanthine phosphoribosyltransferase